MRNTATHHHDDPLHQETHGAGAPTPINLADQNSLIQTIAQLPSLQRRDIVRQLFLADDTLQQTLRAEIAAQAEGMDAEQNQQHATTLRQLRAELAEAQHHTTRSQQTIAQLEDQLLAARVSGARLAEDLQALTHRKRMLEREKQKAERALTVLRDRLTGREPGEKIVTRAEMSPVFLAVMELIDVADKQLLRAGLLSLQPRTAQEASRALDKALRRITTLVEQCRAAIAMAQAAPGARRTQEPSDEPKA